jgi:uncharacterized protein (TIGR03067 family)
MTMRLRVVMVLAAGLLLAADDKKDEAVKRDQDLLRGVWSLSSAEANGQPLPEGTFEGAKLTVKGDEYHVERGEMKLDFEYRLDPTQKPKEIDLIPKDGEQRGKVFRGIYELSEDTFKICRSLQPEQERPKEFAANAGSNLVSAVWKKAKK